MKSLTTPSRAAWMLKLLLLSLALGFAVTSRAGDWWDKEWTIRKKLEIDTAAAGVGDGAGSGVLLVRLHDGVFQFAGAKEDGADIRFVAEDQKTLLPYHVERFDAVLNEAFVWVKVPALKPKTTLWLYYGNQGPKATRVDDVKGTYTPETSLVYHFADRGPASDSSGNSNSAVNAGTAVEGSIIAGGIRVGAVAPIKVAASDSLRWNAGETLTWSAWVKPAAPAANAILFSRRDGGNGFVVGTDNGAPFVEIITGGAKQRAAASGPAAANAWHHVAVVASGGKLALFIDGEPAGTAAGAIPTLASELLIGGDSEEGATAFAGEIDELRIVKAALSPAAIKFASIAEAGGEKAAKLLVFGADEQKTSWFSGGYMGVIVGSLTTDGWIVIGLLSVMFVISWFVMLTKGSFLNAAAKGNARFMTEWEHVAMDLTALDHDDAEVARTLGGRVDKRGLRVMRNSPIFRIYHVGVEEIRHRVLGAGAVRTLPPTSMEAIRASMHGVLTREMQRMNSKIVLLTICISGGPFLGLLGTVVGVMITFAAVAAAGDVNVNAIAPGIAAALLATVAGLAVAIPSLFGYNYLLSRIKDATSDMNVFIDEFVTKVAEFYCGDDAISRRNIAAVRAEAVSHSHDPHAAPQREPAAV